MCRSDNPGKRYLIRWICGHAGYTTSEADGKFGEWKAMKMVAPAPRVWCHVMLCWWAAGCAGPSLVKQASTRAPIPAIKPSERLAQLGEPTLVRPASLQIDAETSSPAAPSQLSANLLAGVKELSVDTVVDQVLARNPSLAQMIAAWQAAAARHPQVTSLEDPMLTGRLGPGSFGSNNVNFAYMVEVSQKLPFPGKLGLRGQNAVAEASAAEQDVDDMRLQLVESAKIAFFDYSLASRALEVNAESLNLLQRARADAESRYENGKADQQDMLGAEVEIGRERERRLAIEEMRQIASARLSTLMHLPADSLLPPPPKELTPVETLPEVHELRAKALARRPDLLALADRIKAEEAALRLAEKVLYPDIEVMAGYDNFWQEKELRAQVGLRANLPVYKARRHGAIAEARAKLAQRQAELERQTDQVVFQVQEAYAKVRKSEQSVRLFQKTILPAAERNAGAARSAYVAGKIPATSRIEAERNLVNLRDRYYETLADSFRRRATLERVIGGPLEAERRFNKP
jgi:cobalt-zinc-cadmium efflux system outer membrane protein